MGNGIELAVSAAVGLGGVAVGLTGDLARRHYQRPKLGVVGYDPASGDAVYLAHPDHGSLYTRLKITNRGRSAAHDVEVCLEGIEPVGQCSAERTRAFEAQAPQAAIGRRFQWSDRNEATIDIPASTSRRVDIAKVSDQLPVLKSKSGEIEVPLRLVFDSGSEIGRGWLPHTSYVLTVSLASSNSPTQILRIRLGFSGFWVGSRTGDPAAGGVNIEIVR